MSYIFNLFCLKCENHIVFALLSVVAVISFCLMAAGLIQAFRRYKNKIKFQKESLRIELVGPAVLIVIGFLFAFVPFFTASYFVLKEQQISIDARSVSHTVGWYWNEVMLGYAPSTPSGKVVVDQTALQVEIKGYFDADCAAEFFLKLCSASDEIICERKSVWKIWTESVVHVRKR